MLRGVIPSRRAARVWLPPVFASAAETSRLSHACSARARFQSVAPASASTVRSAAPPGGVGSAARASARGRRQLRPELRRKIRQFQHPRAVTLDERTPQEILDLADVAGQAGSDQAVDEFRIRARNLAPGLARCLASRCSISGATSSGRSASGAMRMETALRR